MDCQYVLNQCLSRHHNRDKESHSLINSSLFLFLFHHIDVVLYQVKLSVEHFNDNDNESSLMNSIDHSN